MTWADQFMTDADQHGVSTVKQDFEDVAERAEELGVLLATVHALGVKTTNYHWNVLGPFFNQLHELFGEQYVELVAATDVIAEHLRTYGARAPGGYTEFAELSKVDDVAEDMDYADTQAIIADLLAGHNEVVGQLAELGRLGEAEHDDALIDLVGERARAHRKTMWMLRSYLEGQR